MAVTLETFLQSLHQAPDKQTVWQKTEQYFEAMGFNCLIYTELKNGEMEIQTNFPQYWLDHYIDQDYQLIDPFFSHCCASHESVEMGIDYIHKYEYMSQRQRLLIQEASEAGSKAGFSVTFKPLDAHGAGGWNIGSSLGCEEVEKIKKEHEKTLSLASFFAHSAMQKFDVSPIEIPKLTKREKDCILWMTKGLRTKEIAFRLGIRPVTVELHINNAKKKLNAKTREQAVAKAITLQIITP
ncbi:MAG: LuxR family transcriptional regulator [Hyphomicrobiales bacterium]